MRKGISMWAFDPKRPLPEVFQMAKAAGFDGVEVAIAETGPITPESTAEDCAAVRAQAAEAGVELVALASGLGWRYQLTTADEAVRTKAIQVTHASLDVASWLGVDAILLVPGGVGADFISTFPLTPYETAYENALAALRDELAPHAAQVGVSIGVENVWNKFLLSPREMREFVDAAGGTPAVGTYFDVGNVILTGYPEHWIALLGERIRRIHFKDFKRSVGTLAGFCPLGEGDVDWPAVMAALNGIGYDGYVTAEFFNCENDLTTISQAMDDILAGHPVRTAAAA